MNATRSTNNRRMQELRPRKTTTNFSSAVTKFNPELGCSLTGTVLLLLIDFDNLRRFWFARLVVQFRQNILTPTIDYDRVTYSP